MLALAFLIKQVKVGNPIALRIDNTAITTTNSTRVNPLTVLFGLKERTLNN